MNFIIKLLKLKESMTQREYNLILIVIDRLIKYRYFISYLEKSITENLAYIFIKYIIVNYKISKEIINNRDKLFTLKF
jgi:hypothetical protein